MAEALKAWSVPGAAVVVVRGDEVLVLKGYGRKHLDRTDPITPDTAFPLASCTKAFTSAVIATLVDEGELGWDDPVRKHLGGFHLSEPHADALVSIRDLLTHRTGLGSHDLLWYRAPWSVSEQIRRAGALPLDYPFRSGFRYSSLMYAAAGRAAAARAKQPWEMLVKERLTGPLGMKGVCFTTKDVPPESRAGGYHRGDGGKIEPMPAYEITEPNPAGSMSATPRDLATWLSFHLAGGKAVGGRRLVSEKNLAETRTPQNVVRLTGSTRRTNPDSTQLSYAMGWLVYDHRGKRVVAHAGMIDGFRVQLTLLPDENLGFAVCANLHQTRMNLAATNALIDLYCGLPAKDWNAYFLKVVAADADEKRAALEARNKARVAGLPSSLAAVDLAGEYENPAYGTATVTAAGGKLVLAWSNFRCPLEHFEGDTFRVTDGFLKENLAGFGVEDKKAAVLRFLGEPFKRK